MTLSKFAFWKSEGKKAKVNNGSGGAKKFFSQLSGAFMLPISVMAVAGLFLGIGAAINSNATSDGAKMFGDFIKNWGDPVFGAMPILFTMAMVIAFTDDIGTAVFAGIVGFLVFNALQTPFIHAVSDKSSFSDLQLAILKDKNATITDVASFNSWIAGHANEDAVKNLNSGLISQIQTQLGNSTAWDKIQFTDDTGVSTFLTINIGGDFSRMAFKSVGSVAGIKALNTSIFAGIIFGYIAARMYNRFHTITLPSMISFFGGKRFVAFVNMTVAIPLAIIFLLLWPFVAVGLGYFGQYSGKVAGLDSFLFGFVERALIPFGLHHVFYAPLWYTGAGGEIVPAIQDVNTFTQVNGKDAFTFGGTTYTAAAGDLKAGIISAITSGSKPAMGDSFGWLAVNGSGIKTVSYAGHNNVPIFDYLADHKGDHIVNLGRFMQGKFAFMQFGLPAAGAAMIMAAPKENRKVALGTVFPACLTSFVTGVTEPIEFTFLFLAPWLFWGFHALMAAFSFLFMNLLGAHVGMTFSGGFLDAMIYGALPIEQGTHFYWYYLIGAAYAPIYFFVFLFCIKKFNLDTPGRGGNVKLFTKADFKAQQAGSAVAARGSLTPQAQAIVNAFGGWDNITSFKNCATRLRYDVKDNTKVSIDDLKAAGAVGVVPVGTNHFQAIMGPQAEQINTNIKSNVGAPLGGSAAPAKTEAAKLEVEATPAKKPAAKKTAKK